MNSPDPQLYVQKSTPSRFNLPFQPLAESDSIILSGNTRFTVLATGVIRMEYSSNAAFEDRPSQLMWFRKQPKIPFSKYVSEDKVEIVTDELHLVCCNTLEKFSSQTLRITLLKSGAVYQFGSEDSGNLGGTVRTLDGKNGPVEISPGLISRSGWSLVDDSDSPVFDEQGWPCSRQEGNQDFYFFGYGSDYKKCINQFCALSGSIPLPPRFVFGNWWSRYWAYSQSELETLVEDFAKHGIPLSVCVVDMDWHIVKNPYHRGWTGYSWNRDLFPDPEGFFRFLHTRGIRSSLNLHPRDGVHPHEDAYAKMAEYMGIDFTSKQPVEFNVADPKFMKGYFEFLHHPLEQSGVDFWWIDWQQGTESGIKGLDPLFQLNHLHFLDSARDGKRPFIFSRYCGLGGHRYPIGFSGDTHVTWQSLAFQPYFTSTAANVGFCYWSHDIGGHFHGTEDPELYLRWVQFGVFSPILRIHSSNSSFQDRRPFVYDPTTFQIIRDAMRLRHSIIPYIYSCSRLTEITSVPFVRPMYFEYPQQEEAFVTPAQYYFGKDLIVAPFTNPVNPETGLSSQLVWLPQGHWYNFFSGEYMGGDRLFHEFGGKDQIPVYAPAGSIIPCASDCCTEADKNPHSLKVKVFAGASGEFVLYEDDGVSQEYKSGAYVETLLTQKWNENSMEIRINPSSGNQMCIPCNRNWILEIFGIDKRCTVSVKVNQLEKSFTHTYDSLKEVLLVEVPGVVVSELIVVTIETSGYSLLARRDRTYEKLENWLFRFKAPIDFKHQVEKRMNELKTKPEILEEIAQFLTVSQAEIFYETVLRAGFDFNRGKALLLWNEQGSHLMHYSIHSGWGSVSEKGVVPRRKILCFNKVTDEEQNRIWLKETWVGSVSYKGIKNYCYHSQEILE